jgi:hypothetical protein
MGWPKGKTHSPETRAKMAAAQNPMLVLTDV